MGHHIYLPENFTEFCYRLIRGALYAFTFILCILGASLVVFSFWYILEGKSYHLDNTIKFGIFSISFITGFLLFILSTCGLIGVLRENVLMAKLYLFGMMLLILIEIVCLFLIYAYKLSILEHSNFLFQNFLIQYTENDDVRALVDTIQSDLKCCGITSPSDWESNPYYKCSSTSTFACSVPASCCYNYSMNASKVNMFCGIGIREEELGHKMYQLIHISGCKFAIYSFLDYKHKLTASILIGFLVPQFIGVLFIISFILILNYLKLIDSLETRTTSLIKLNERNDQREEKEESKSKNILNFNENSKCNSEKEIFFTNKTNELLPNSPKPLKIHVFHIS